MERYAWKAKVIPGKLEEYRKRHNNIWPEMKAMLKEAGISNYSIWNTGDELFGYYECESVAKASEIQARSEINAKWDVHMKDVMTMERDPITGAQPLLKEVWYFK
ncbi:MAG: L-rhamnose mutarotase [Sphaerochaetaceae bacterium]